MTQTTIPAGTTDAEAAPSAPKSILRFIVPFIEMLIVSLVAKLGFHVTAKTAAEILAVGTPLLGTLLLSLEHRWPWFGALLGYIGAPSFPPTVKAQMDAYTTSLEARVAELEAKITESASPSAPSATEVKPVPAPATPTLVAPEGATVVPA